jgi:probable phosphoglycerate mutase
MPDVAEPAAAESTAALPDAAGTTLYLVRHGQTEYNRKGIVQGRCIDSVLNATGRQQAAALARRFANVALDAVYASTLRRARQTAEVVAERHPILGRGAVRCDADLEEMSWGCLEGEPTTDAVLDIFDDVKSAWRAGRFERKVEGGESALDVQTRALRAVRRILQAQAGGAVLVVAHGRFLRVLIVSLLDAEYGLKNMHRVAHDNTCVNHLAWDAEGACAARLLNCTAHLERREAQRV